MSDLPLFDELSRLVGALREGTIEDAEMARLDQILSEHPEALDRFVDLAILESDLSRRFGPRREMPVRALSPRRRRTPALLAAAGLLGITLLVAFSLRSRRDEAPDVPSFDGCAVLAQAVDPVWEGRAPQTGSVLAAGLLALRSGWVQIEFFSGARVVLEGPAEFDLLSRNEASCPFGKLRAFVPPQAEGFAIRTGALRLVDRGTEFGLRRKRNGDAEVHVFQGKVEVHKETSEPKPVTGGQAVRIGPAGVAESIPADPQAFVTPSDLARRSSLEARSRYSLWKESSARLARDPRVALYYSFEDQDPWASELRSQRVAHSSLDGAIVGCKWTEGRWPAKKALEFKGLGDRVRFLDAGSYDSITLMAWVRVDGLDRVFSGLMLTDGWTTGSVHWQIHQRGLLRLGIHGSQRTCFDYDTPPLFGAGRLGRWTHVATVYDRDARAVSHYVDGQLIIRLSLRFDTLLTLRSAELGNWGVPIPGSTDTYSVRNLNGRMDEFALFGSALKEEEIRACYAAGAP
jgi:hypothetical protein